MKSRMDGLHSPALRAELEARLPGYIAARRWFRSKTRTIASASVTRVFSLAGAGDDIALAVVRVVYAEGQGENYTLVLEWVREAAVVEGTRQDFVIAGFRGEPQSWILDALGGRQALVSLMTFVARGASVAGWSSDGTTSTLSARTFGPVGGIDDPRPVETEQSNTSVVFGGRSILKIIRRLDEGRSPELEMSEYLTRAGFPSTPPLLAALELDEGAPEPATVAVVHAYVPNEGDAWTYTLRTVGVGGASEETAFVGRMAERIAAMHAILAAPTNDPRFAAEPLTRVERETLAADVERSLSTAVAKVDGVASVLPREMRARLDAALRARGPLRRIAAALLDVEPCWKTRVHGDLHLGQLLASGGDFVVIDFEGEPARSPRERKGKRSPMADVAGMLRSLHYASLVSGAGPTWFTLAKQAFLKAYDAAPGPSALPARPSDREALLRFFLLEKCAYELHYELDNRPDWVDTPLEGLEQLMREVDAG
jgi:trehalose synthase-fused probable maltokinase